MRSEYRLSDIIEIIGGGTPKTSKREYWSGSIPWLSVKDFNNNSRYVYNTEKKITEQGLSNSTTTLLSKDDIIISARGTVGALAMIPYPMAFNQSCYGIRAKKDKIVSTYLYYLLKNNVQLLKQRTHGSVFDTITRKSFDDVIVQLPDMEEQKRVAFILSILDDKIELNQRINDNLAALLQCVYQQQFGNTLESASVGPLAEICDYSRDKVAVSTLTPSTYYSTENMLAEKAGAVEASSLPTVAQTTKCAVGDVLISNIRPYFKKIVYCQSECGCSTDVLCFRPKMPDLSAYLFCTLYADCFFDFIVAGSKGTKMPRGDKQQIMTYMVNIPSSEELCKFNAVAVPVLSHMESNRAENVHLSALRNTLLPKLMSGNLEVSGLDL